MDRIRHHAAEGVICLADGDNTYDRRLFDQDSNIKVVGSNIKVVGSNIK